MKFKWDIIKFWKNVHNVIKNANKNCVSLKNKQKLLWTSKFIKNRGTLIEICVLSSEKEINKKREKVLSKL